MMSNVFTSLLTGLLFGLTAGLSPGPLMVLTVTQTLRHGTAEGTKVALAPLITDVPIVLAALYLLQQLASFDAVLGIIGMVGGLYVLYLGYETFNVSPPSEQAGQVPASIRRGATVNALSPHPYLFWATVGGPFTLDTARESLLGATLFIGCFYICLVGAKVLISLLVGRWRDLLTSGAYQRIMRILALLLIGFGLVLLQDGLGLLGLMAA